MQTEAQASLQLALKAYIEALTRLIEDTAQLVALEGKLAGRTLVWMAIMGVGAAVLILTAWGMVNVVLIMWLSSTFIGLQGSLLGMAFVNVIIASGLILWILRVSRFLTFPATRRIIFRHEQPD
ncbi:MAG: hypothetical protein D6819_03425 [Gammaproteobacteria bacterium]|nr:MAG: hypothetical protein D6819_03425 [Gammaproteobacteria bacterium]